MLHLTPLKVCMKRYTMVPGLLLSLALAAGNAAWAQVNFNIVLAPPEPMVEAMPMLPPGYVWAPGYWAWNHDRHIWVRGHSMLQRTGYRWEPDRWEQRDGHYARQAGYWVRDDARPIKAMKMEKPMHDNGNRQNGKKDKKDKRWKEGREDSRGNGR